MLMAMEACPRCFLNLAVQGCVQRNCFPLKNIDLFLLCSLVEIRLIGFLLLESHLLLFIAATNNLAIILVIVLRLNYN